MNYKRPNDCYPVLIDELADGDHYHLWSPKPYIGGNHISPHRYASEKEAVAISDLFNTPPHHTYADVLGNAGFDLHMWEVGPMETTPLGQRVQIAYRLEHEGEIIFEGHRFSPPPNCKLPDPIAASNLLGFLSLRPGWDTDDEYFDRHEYTDEQREWAKAHGEELSIIARDLEEFIPVWGLHAENEEGEELVCKVTTERFYVEAELEKTATLLKALLGHDWTVHIVSGMFETPAGEIVGDDMYDPVE